MDTNNVEIKIKVSITISEVNPTLLTANGGNNQPVKFVNTTTHKLKKKVTSSGGNKTALIGIPSGKEIFGIGKIIVNKRPDSLDHFGTEILLNSLHEIADEYSLRHPGIRINDMSLPYRGKFDIESEWNGIHAEQREGKNADVSFRGLNSTNSIVNININQMNNIIQDVTGLHSLIHYPPDPPHLHI